MFDDGAALTAATMVDFGLDERERIVNVARFQALQRAVRRGVTADQLHKACNFPVKLNALVDNEVSFDGMKGELPMPEAEDAA